MGKGIMCGGKHKDCPYMIPFFMLAKGACEEGAFSSKIYQI